MCVIEQIMVGQYEEYSQCMWKLIQAT
jgi:hypothetical protein